MQVRSAGSAPAETVNPLVVQAMAECGVDLSEAFPKGLTDDAVRAADVVVTMGCGDACPIYPGKCYEDWQVDDPAETSSISEVRRIRDEIDQRVQRLLSQLRRADYLLTRGERIEGRLGRASSARLGPACDAPRPDSRRVRPVREKIDRQASQHAFIHTRYGVGYKLEALPKS